MKKAKYIMIGGFLGAGKSTSILQLARRLAKDYKVGLITNDQAAGLVDTNMLSSQGFQVEEIAGGCFCCKFDSLMQAAENLSQEHAPDIFIAEPVGSCTDLVATVSYPLRRIYGDDFAVSPLSVVIDPIRAARVLGLAEGKNFSRKVVYIYRKQLEEADIIVINKSDLLTEEQLQKLQQKLTEEFPQARLFVCSARENSGLDTWLDTVMAEEMGAGNPLDIDYETYAEGEALLGWMNCTVSLQSDKFFDGNQLLESVCRHLQAQLNKITAEIAHLKMTLLPTHSNDIATINLVRNDYVPELSQKLQDSIQEGQLIINLRAENDPEVLHDFVHNTVDYLQNHYQLKCLLDHIESFRPGKPVPTHRMQTTK